MSFVSMLTTDDRTTENPSWKDVETAIAALDAKIATLVILAPPPPKGPPEGDHQMAIGGGKDGRYIVYVTEDNLRFWNLEDPTKMASATRVVVLVGGQEGEYREAQCIPKEWVMRAAREYFERGARAADLSWSES